jgi:hypothetical protein
MQGQKQQKYQETDPNLSGHIALIPGLYMQTLGCIRRHLLMVLCCCATLGLQSKCRGALKNNIKSLAPHGMMKTAQGETCDPGGYGTMKKLHDFPQC